MTLTITLAGKAWASEETAPQEGSATVAETHAATEAAHGEAATFPPFDPAHFASQLLWLAITFGLFYWFMSRVAIPRIAGILEVRRDRISGDLDEAQRMRDEADAAHAAYEHELAAARARASSIAQESGDRARAQAEAERRKVEAGLAARLQEAEARIDAIRKKALAEVDAIASDATAAIVKELVGASATRAEIAKAVGSATKRDEAR